MIRVENSISKRYTTTPSYKGKIFTRNWSQKDLERHVAAIIREAEKTGAVKSLNPLKNFANSISDIASIITANRKQATRKINGTLNVSV